MISNSEGLRSLATHDVFFSQATSTHLFVERAFHSTTPIILLITTHGDRTLGVALEPAQ